MQLLDDQISDAPKKPYKNYNDKLVMFTGLSVFILALVEVGFWCNVYQYPQWLSFFLLLLWMPIVLTLFMGLLMKRVETLRQALFTLLLLTTGEILHGLTLEYLVESDVWGIIVFMVPNVVLALYVGGWLYFWGIELPWKTPKRKA